jgi:hypothetical protein
MFEWLQQPFHVQYWHVALLIFYLIVSARRGV